MMSTVVPSSPSRPARVLVPQRLLGQGRLDPGASGRRRPLRRTYGPPIEHHQKASSKIIAEVVMPAGLAKGAFLVGARPRGRVVALSE